jgi:hypothetical protein
MQSHGPRNPAGALRSGGAHDRGRALHREPAQLAAHRHVVERAIGLLRGTIEALIADAAVSHDRALVIVVMDPHAPPGLPFEDAILVQASFGRAPDVEVDYARYALDKARASFRERCDTAALREHGGALLSADLPPVGGIHRKGWTLGVSGAVPAFDEAIGAMLIELVCAFQPRPVAATSKE